MLAFNRMRSVVAVLAGLVFLAACADPPPLHVDQVYVRMSANAAKVPGAPSAGYFVLHGGAADVELRDVITDRALRVEMHESIAKNGQMHMVPLDKVPVAAGKQVAFAPGGKHLMLWGVNPGAIEQGKMPLTFLFSNGDRIIVDAVIQKAGTVAALMAADNAMKGH